MIAQCLGQRGDRLRIGLLVASRLGPHAFFSAIDHHHAAKAYARSVKGTRVPAARLRLPCRSIEGPSWRSVRSVLSRFGTETVEGGHPR